MSDYSNLDTRTEQSGKTGRKLILLVVALALVGGAIAAIVILVKKSDDKPDYLKQLADQIDSTRDPSKDPCDDFYLYACGRWLDKTVLRPDQTRASRSFDVIADNNQAVLLQVLQNTFPILDPFFKACMDTATINQKGIAPIQTWMNNVRAIANKDDLAGMAGQLLAEMGVNTLFGLGVIVDSMNPQKSIVDFGQGGLSLDDASYYVGSDNVTADLQNHIKTMFTLYGDSAADAATKAQAVINFELAIAQFTLPPDQVRDPYAIYHKYTFDSLTAGFTNINWGKYLDGAQIPKATLDLNIEVPNPFMTGLNALWASTDLPSLRAYFEWHLLHQWAQWLPDTFVNEDFRFFGQAIGGAKAQKSRDKVCVGQTDSNLPDELGKKFVERAFPGESKTMVQTMINDIEHAFEKNFPNVEWMDDITRANATVKLHQVVDLVGFPDRWTDYSSVTLKADDYFGNTVGLTKFHWQSQLNVLKTPVDKTRWQMSPPTVNAYYDPSYNTINFPAGIIQPTFFSAKYTGAVNYGGIGMVMGHELTHGFDDQGRQYDGTGKLTQWWSDQIIANFKAKADCLIEQYSQYKYPWSKPEEHVNGNLTLGENIADNGGIRTAFRAYQDYVARNGADPVIPTSPPMTANQLFFTSFAQGWCTQITQEAAKLRLKIDPHSPAFARVIGPLQNFDEFSKAFNCSANAKMNPAKKCVLW